MNQTNFRKETSMDFESFLFSDKPNVRALSPISHKAVHLCAHCKDLGCFDTNGKDDEDIVNKFGAMSFRRPRLS